MSLEEVTRAMTGYEEGGFAVEEKRTALELRTGLNAPKGFIEQVFEIDKQTYSPELCGVSENMYSRYERCRDSFLLLYRAETLIGYICFLPIGESLRAQLDDPADRAMRDDVITPEEMEDWSLEHLNHLFILSVVILPEYRDGQAIRVLGDGWLAYLRDKECRGYTIGSISGSAVSEGGERFIRRFRGHFVKELDEGYRYYLADRENIEELLRDGLLL